MDDKLVFEDEIDKSLSVDNQDSEEFKHIYPINYIKLDKGQFSLFELKRRFENKQIILDSSFQRDEVWTIRQKIELIESILMGLPLPVFYFNQDSEGNIIVIDGRQRLTAIFSYMNNEFCLSKLKVLGSSFEKEFDALPPVYQTKIENYQILSYVILPETPSSVKFDIFDRVNRGGTRLNKQEIRNALFQGKSTELLNAVSKSELFETATAGGLKGDKRMKDRYLLLRFLAFYLLQKEKIMEQKTLYVYTNIDDLLEKTMKLINKMEMAEYEWLKNMLYKTLENCCYFFDGNVFRLKNLERKSPINMNVFETVMYILSHLDKNADKNLVIDKVERMKNDPDFLDAIGNHRDSVQKVEMRFNMAKHILKELER